jgi:hypothetical protein
LKAIIVKDDPSLVSKHIQSYASGTSQIIFFENTYNSLSPIYADTVVYHFPNFVRINNLNFIIYNIRKALINEYESIRKIILKNKEKFLPGKNIERFHEDIKYEIREFERILKYFEMFRDDWGSDDLIFASSLVENEFRKEKNIDIKYDIEENNKLREELQEYIKKNLVLFTKIRNFFYKEDKKDFDEAFKIFYDYIKYKDSFSKKEYMKSIYNDIEKEIILENSFGYFNQTNKYGVPFRKLNPVDKDYNFKFEIINQFHSVNAIRKNRNEYMEQLVKNEIITKNKEPGWIYNVKFTLNGKHDYIKDYVIHEKFIASYMDLNVGTQLYKKTLDFSKQYLEGKSDKLTPEGFYTIKYDKTTKSEIGDFFFYYPFDELEPFGRKKISDFGSYMAYIKNGDVIEKIMGGIKEMGLEGQYFDILSNYFVPQLDEIKIPEEKTKYFPKKFQLSSGYSEPKVLYSLIKRIEDVFYNDNELIECLSVKNMLSPLGIEGFEEKIPFLAGFETEKILFMGENILEMMETSWGIFSLRRGGEVNKVLIGDELLKEYKSNETKAITDPQDKSYNWLNILQYERRINKLRDAIIRNLLLNITKFLDKKLSIEVIIQKDRFGNSLKKKLNRLYCDLIGRIKYNYFGIKKKEEKV